VISYQSRSTTSIPKSLSASVSPDENNSKAKISYRRAKPTDVTAIAELLNSVFEEEKEVGDQGEIENTTTDKSKDGDDDNNTFMWDTLTDENDNPQLSFEEQFQLIERQLSKRMMDAKKEDSLPHSFLVATIPSSLASDTKAQAEDRIVGFLEMGTLPPPISNSPFGNAELPYIGNVAVSNDARRRKVGTTLVRLATKIASTWCNPSTKTSSFRPFLFLSVERSNCNALKFYKQLGFEDLKVAKISTEKIYLAQELD